MGDSRMKKMWKRMMAVLLAGVMLAGVVPVDVLASVLSEEDVIRLEKEQATGSVGVGEVEVTATNSFGELLTEVYNTEATEQEKNNGCNVFSVEVNGTQATVDFETVEDGMVVVCIYEEDGNKMLASGSAEVEAGETLTDVTIETDSMPNYFYLRAFLIDTISLRPLCTVYESPMYTKEMQDFLSKTTDDFDADRVLNLDDDKTNNFAVFEEDTKFVEQGQNTNIVVSVDETNHVYIIENPDESITSLVAGDIFSCEYGDGDLLIVKVASVVIEGNQAVITGMETSMEEVFEYVKIDESVGVDEASVDSSGLEEGVIYEGIVEEEGVYNDAVSNQKIDIGGSVGQSLKYTFAEKTIGTDMAGIKLSGTLNLNVTTSLKVYITLSKQYVEWKLDYAMGLNASISGHAKGEVPLSTIAFSPMVGVFVEFIPSFVVEASAAVSLSGSVSGTVGVRVSNSEGIKNLTTNPQTSILLEGEFEVFIGIEFNPRIKVISDHVAKLDLAAQVGARAEGTWFGVSSDMDKNCVHDCDRCIEGEVYGVLGGSMSAQIFNSSKLKWSRSYEWSVKICDFYWSKTFNDCGLSECPYRRYRVTVELFDANKEPIRGALVNGTYKTDDDGKVILYLPLGKNMLTIVRDEIGTVVREVKVYARGNRVQMRIDRISGEDDEDEDDKSGGEVSLGSGNSAVITENGDLYTWGASWNGQLGDGTATDRNIPIKIMGNIKAVSLGYDHSAAISKNGDLYTWGGICLENWEMEQQQVEIYQ